MKKTLLTTALIIASALIAVLAIIFTVESRTSEVITINYSQPISELIQSGNYSVVFIKSENYKVKQKGIEKIKVRLFTFHFLPLNEYNEHEEEYVLQTISDKGYRPANFIELLHYKITHPNPKMNIIALGSVYVDIYKNSPVIQKFIDSNNNIVYRLDEDRARCGYFGSGIGFLAVKK